MITDKLKYKIEEYCKLNNIEDVDKFINDTLSTGLNTVIYGATPFGDPKTKEVEVIKEVIKEVPVEVEKIVEKEVIKEVPMVKEVEVVKEVEKIVEREVFVTDDEAVNQLNTKVGELESQLKSKTEEIGNLNERIKQYSDLYESDTTHLETQVNKYSETIDELRLVNERLDEEVTRLSKENAKLKAQNPSTTDDDMYGEGTFGSNLIG